MIETLLAIDKLLDELPGQGKSAFILSQFSGLTYPEIAEQLNIMLSRFLLFGVLAPMAAGRRRAALADAVTQRGAVRSRSAFGPSGLVKHFAAGPQAMAGVAGASDRKAPE